VDPVTILLISVVCCTVPLALFVIVLAFFLVREEMGL
jgi:hypothetical protein